MSQEQPNKGMSPLMIVLAVIGGMAVLAFGSCVVCVVCVGVGAHGVAKAEADKKVAATAGRAAASTVDLAPLLAEYKDNEVRADAHYKGAWVRVSGIVGDTKKDVMGGMYVTVGTGKAFELPEVQCFLDAGQEGAAARLQKGGRVTVMGRVDGLMMNVLLHECSIES